MRLVLIRVSAGRGGGLFWANPRAVVVVAAVGDAAMVTINDGSGQPLTIETDEPPASLVARLRGGLLPSVSPDDDPDGWQARK